MKTDLNHLPDIQRTELDRVQKILHAEFAEATSRASQSWKRNGKIQKIILFGSYSRSDWVDEPENGYQSDFDLLIIVSHSDLTDIADYWYVSEDKILRDEEVRRPVNIIVHTPDELNQGLRKGFDTRTCGDTLLGKIMGFPAMGWRLDPSHYAQMEQEGDQALSYDSAGRVIPNPEGSVRSRGTERASWRGARPH
ncbi:nucleotidyltransferase domain-containing protein [Sphingobium sp.]|uniref:nucleotidyltransferase domain-containing protein n=1 Tax=Sphingobium sp. TaxID=1912891 RepID=UPI0028BF18F4|nr:nucleotidyltransferase domain-containing protein [Sphingobium sp.]